MLLLSAVKIHEFPQDLQTITQDDTVNPFSLVQIYFYFHESN